MNRGTIMDIKMNDVACIDNMLGQLGAGKKTINIPDDLSESNLCNAVRDSVEAYNASPTKKNREALETKLIGAREDILTSLKTNETYSKHIQESWDDLGSKRGGMREENGKGIKNRIAGEGSPTKKNFMSGSLDSKLKAVKNVPVGAGAIVKGKSMTDITKGLRR